MLTENNGHFCTSTTMLMSASDVDVEQVCADGDRSLGQHVFAKRGNVDTRASTKPIGPKSQRGIWGGPKSLRVVERSSIDLIAVVCAPLARLILFFVLE